jgi:hypothetical protein
MWQPEKLFTKGLKDIAGDLYIKYINEIEYPEDVKYYKRSGKVYYLRISNDSHTLYKIGFTMKTIRERVESLNISYKYKVDVIASLSFAKASQALIIEGLLHKEFKEWRYKGLNLFDFNNGNTEVYVKDVLNIGNKFKEEKWCFEDLLKRC